VTPGVPFADGLLCLGASPLLVAGRRSNGLGFTNLYPRVFARGAWTPGGTVAFQALYRDALGPCAQGTNTSNSVRITFVP
jgi:hypothetical protein